MDAIFLRAFFSLFLILGTFGNVFLFDTILSNYTTNIKKKREAIRKAYIIAYLIWIPIFILGDKFLYIFGITRESFAIAGSIFLAIISFEIISRDLPSFTNINGGEKLEGVIVSPMAVPLITGPGAITTTIIFRSMISNILLLFVVFTLAYFMSFLFIYISISIINKLNRKYFIVLNRLFGLILLAIVVEILINAIKSII